METILLLETHLEHAQQLKFLLELAHYRCSLSGSVEETLNKLMLGAATGKAFDLLLLGSTLDSAAGKLLMQQIPLQQMPPVVCALRVGSLPPDYLLPQVRVCLTDNLLPFLREIFSQKNNELEIGGTFMTEHGTVHQEERQALGTADSMEGKYLTFVLAEEGYGLEIRHVTEIIGIQSVTNIPEMPSYFKGVVNLRGKVIPVIDVRLRFKLQEREYDERTCIIVVDVAERSVGLVVDKVSEVIDIPLTDIEPAPMSKEQQDRSYIRGMGKIGEQVKILLDIERLLLNEDLDGVEAEAV